MVKNDVLRSTDDLPSPTQIHENPRGNDFTIRCSDLSENPLLIRTLSRHIRVHSGDTIERSKTNESPNITLSPLILHTCAKSRKSRLASGRLRRAAARHAAPTHSSMGTARPDIGTAHSCTHTASTEACK